MLIRDARLLVKPQSHRREFVDDMAVQERPHAVSDLQPHRQFRRNAVIAIAPPAPVGDG
jgi:hypothetical protein